MVSLEHVMKQSLDLISQHGVSLDPKYKLHIILDKTIRKFGEEQGNYRRENGFCIKSYVKLLVKGGIDDEGIAYIQQTINQGETKLMEVGYRVKYGETEGDLTRTVKKFE